MGQAMADNDRTHGRRIRRAAGCIVYREVAGEPHFLLIRDPYERWTLAKGHLEGNESDQEAAIREVAEETGIHGQLGPLVGTIVYTFFAHGHQVEKRVTFFLMKVSNDITATPQLSEGISAVDWFPASEAANRIGYDQVREIFLKGSAMVAKQYSGEQRH